LILTDHCKFLKLDLKREQQIAIKRYQVAFTLIIVLLGPAVLLFPLIIPQALKSGDSQTVALISLFLAMTTLGGIYCSRKTAGIYLGSQPISTLPFSKLHGFLVRAYFSIFAHKIVIGVLLASIVIEYYTTESLVAMDTQAISNIVICGAAMVCAGFGLRHAHYFLEVEITLLFLIAYFSLSGSFLVPALILAASLLLIQFRATALNFRPGLVRTVFADIVINTHYLRFLTLLALSLFCFHWLEISNPLILSAFAFITTILFGQSFSRALLFYQNHKSAVSIFPYGTLQLKQKVALTCGLLFNTQMILIGLVCLMAGWLSNITLLLCLLTSFLFGVVFSFIKDELRLPLQCITWLVYVMTLY